MNNHIENEHKQVAVKDGLQVARPTRKLAETNEELQLQAALLQHLPVSAWTLKPDGTPDFVNQVWLEFSGQTLDFVRSYPEAWMTVVHPEDREATSRAFWVGVSSGQGFAIESRSLRARDKTYRWHLQQAVVLRDAEGKIIKFVGTTTDIDDQKRAEAKLRESEYDARLIVDSIPGLIAVLNVKGDIERVSQPIVGYFGRSLEQLRQWALDDTIHPDDRPGYLQAFERAFSAGDPFEHEVRIRRLDGVYRWFDMRGRPLHDWHGHVVRWYFLLTEVDDRKRAEEALTKARAELAHVVRITSLGVLTASIAHEVNQPLSGIITNAGTCLRMLSVDPPNLEGARETARRTIRDGNRASDVIKRLRTLYSKKEPSLEPMDLNEVAREVIALLLSELQGNGAVLQHEFADRLPIVMGDRIQLQQVILNLVRNASDAMRDIEDRPRRLLICTEQIDEDVCFTVQDSGIGFDPAIAGRLFEPFYTTKQEGMGIGLSVSQSIVEAHGGRLWAIGSPGRGATFHLILPAVIPGDR